MTPPPRTSKQEVFSLAAAVAVVALVILLMLVFAVGPTYWWPPAASASSAPTTPEAMAVARHPALRFYEATDAADEPSMHAAFLSTARHGELKMLKEAARRLPPGAVVALCNEDTGSCAVQLAEFLRDIARPDTAVLALCPDRERAEFVRWKARERGVGHIVVVAAVDLHLRGARLDTLVSRVDLLLLTRPGTASLDACRNLVVANRATVALRADATSAGETLGRDMGYVASAEDDGCRLLRPTGLPSAL